MIVILLQNIVWVANSLLLFLKFPNIDLCDRLINASEETIKIIQYLDYFNLDNINFDDIPWDLYYQLGKDAV